MTTDQIQFIREKCIEANPQIVERHDSCKAHGKRGGLFKCICQPRPIRLADVLVAIGNMMVIVDARGNFYKLEMKLSDKMPSFDEKAGTAKWNLLKDDLREQREETLEFIANLLKA